MTRNTGTAQVRTAQANGVCPFCPWPIAPRDEIAKLPGRAWGHARCVAAVQAAERGAGPAGPWTRSGPAR